MIFRFAFPLAGREKPEKGRGAALLIERLPPCGEGGSEKLVSTRRMGVSL